MLLSPHTCDLLEPVVSFLGALKRMNRSIITLTYYTGTMYNITVRGNTA